MNLVGTTILGGDATVCRNGDVLPTSCPRCDTSTCGQWGEYIRMAMKGLVNVNRRFRHVQSGRHAHVWNGYGLKLRRKTTDDVLGLFGAPSYAANTHDNTAIRESWTTPAGYVVLENVVQATQLVVYASIPEVARRFKAQGSLYESFIAARALGAPDEALLEVLRPIRRATRSASRGSSCRG